MRRLFGSRVYHHTTRLGILLLVAALIVAVTNCAPIQQHTLSVRSTLGGSVAVPGEGGFFYGTGEVVELEAEAEKGYRFVNWTGDVDTIVDVEAASTTITMNGDYSITANFVTQYVLTIDSTEGGEVTVPGEGTFTYDAGTVVELVAEAEEGYTFMEWTGDVDSVTDVTATSTTVIMNGEYSITAEFGKADPAELFAGGTGTEEEPYQIVDWHHLSNVRYVLGAHYQLMNSLDFDTPGYAELASPTASQGRGWQPIGTSADRFAGSFDGHGYQIRDLFVNRPDQDGVGLFGYAGAGGVIANVGITSALVAGRFNVGGLVGWNEGAVDGCCAAASVTGERNVGGLSGVIRSGTVTNSCSSGKVAAHSSVGGLVGANHGAVSTSHSGARVTGSSYVGGLVGASYEATVSNSYSSGSVSGHSEVGGLVGFNSFWATVSNSYSAGTVNGLSNVGGLVGINYAGGTVDNSFWDTETSGQDTSDGGIGKTTGQMRSIDTFLEAGWRICMVSTGETDPACIWNVVEGEAYPFLSWQRVQ